jgi:hypothetical protein
MGQDRNVCDIERVPHIDTSGDGVVRLGDISNKVGFKIILDINKYNTLKDYNYKHSDIMGSGPFLETLHDIIYDNEAYIYQSIFRKHFDNSLALDHSARYSSPLENIDSYTDSMAKEQKPYQYIVISGKADDISIIEPGNHTDVQQEDDRPSNQYSSNVSVFDFGDNKYIFSDIKPLDLLVVSSSLQPVSVTVGYSVPAQVSGSSGQSGYSYEHLSVTHQAEPVIVGDQTSISISTHIQDIHSIVSSSDYSSTTLMTTASSSTPTISLNHTDGPLQSDIVSLEFTTIEQVQGGVQSMIYEQSYQDGGQTVEEVHQNILTALSTLKINIQNSSVKEPYKSRYYKKALALERKYLSEDLISFAGGSSTMSVYDLYELMQAEGVTGRFLRYLDTNFKSLVAILEELSKEKRRLYLGSLSRYDIAFLYREFYKVIRAMI